MSIVKLKGGRRYFSVGKKRLKLPKGLPFPSEHLVYFDLQGSHIIIEDGVSFSNGVYIYTHTHNFEVENWRKLPIIGNKNATILKKNCFIGTNVIILDSCKYIGISSVIAAGSVVTKDVPDYEIWAGNPAKKIKDVKKI